MIISFFFCFFASQSLFPYYCLRNSLIQLDYVLKLIYVVILLVTHIGAVVKEAMLVIRGSKSIMDWSINLEEEMCDYSYTHIVSQGSPFLSTTTYSTSAGGAGKTSADGEFYTRTVNGTIHKGLHTAAMGLLEGYNLRSTLLRLLGLDYQVKVVGHSLGAGIAALIAAELRITLIAKHLHMYEHPTPEDSSAFAVAAAVASAAAASASASTKSTPLSGQKAGAPNSPSSPLPAPFSVTRPATGTRVPAYLRQVVNSISAVVFSSPAFLTINLADAFLADRILINTVYDKDIIPRFSFKTIQIMAEELKDPDFCAQADLWTQQDKTDFSNYAISMGRAADIYQCGMAAAAAEAEEVAAEEEGLRGVAVPVAEALASDGSSTAAAPATMEVISRDLFRLKLSF